MRNIRLIVILCGIGLLGFCCILACLTLDGYYLPNKPCRPLTYPNAQQTTAQFIHTTTNSIESVLQFYDEKLNVQQFPANTGQWKREILSDGRYLYSCYGVDINLLTTETGCIYLKGETGSTAIETMLLRSEGSNTPCPRSPRK